MIRSRQPTIAVYLHLAILGYSRYKCFDASLRVCQGDVFYALEKGFFTFQGLAERLQADNAKVFVLNASADQFRWNPKFLQFCGFFSIEPCRSAASGRCLAIRPPTSQNASSV